MNKDRNYILRSGLLITKWFIIEDYYYQLHGKNTTDERVEEFIAELISAGEILKTQEEFTVEELVDTGLYAEAVKLHREQTGCSLIEAKEHIDELKEFLKSDRHEYLVKYWAKDCEIDEGERKILKRIQELKEMRDSFTEIEEYADVSRIIVALEWWARAFTTPPRL